MGRWSECQGELPGPLSLGIGYICSDSMKTWMIAAGEQMF